jgi:crotonobetainyl-CoA:carnitine CoA-transferase CaiB-like acyl-CoA transferase
MMLGDMGADVLKIEMPAAVDPDVPVSSQQRHSHTNRNKRSLALNLKTSIGLAIFQRLAARADVIVEGFRPGVMGRLGAGYDILSASNPRLIYCAMSSFGQDGPYRDRPAHDLNFLALSGCLSTWGSGAKPDIPLNLVADYGGAAMHAALAIALALLARNATGQGQFIDISYLDSTIALLAATPNMRGLFSGASPPSAGTGVFCGGYPYYAIYSTRDEKQLTVACSEPHLWRNFCVAIGCPELGIYCRASDHYQRAPNSAEVAAYETVAGILSRRDRHAWLAHFASVNVCIAPVLSVPEMLENEQVGARGVVSRGENGDQPFSFFRSPMRFSRTPATLRRPAPSTGQHSRDVLNELGLSATEIQTMFDKGVVA